MRSLARAIARGRTYAGWAKSKDVSVDVAREWALLPEFRQRVEQWRLEHAERVVGKIAMCVERAIERLVELSEHSSNGSVCVAATKAIIDKWISTSVHFVQEQKFQSLDARMNVLIKARAAEKQTGMRNGVRWR